MFEKEVGGVKFCLIGIGVILLGEMILVDLQDLIDQQVVRCVKVEVVIDMLWDKFGNCSVEIGYIFCLMDSCLW